MANEGHLRIIKKRVEVWNEWRKDNPDIKPDLTGVELNGANLSGADLSEANFEGAKLNRAILTGSNLTKAIFDDADLSDADLTETNLNGARLRKTILNEAILSKATLIKVILSIAELKGAILEGTILEGANLTKANFSGAKLGEANLNDVTIKETIFRNAILDGANFAGVKFDGANLQKASLREIKVDKETMFDSVETVDGAIIDRFTLESLVNYGGLTTGQRMLMDIRDDVAFLRSRFSGFWQWVHLIGMLLFLFPYIWFAFKMWIVAKFDYGKNESITMAEAFVRYIVSGGDSWHEGWNFKMLAVTTFSVAIVYNVLRGMLLYKTKKLELQETISGLPQRFNLKGSKWGKVYTASRVILYIFLVTVVWHTIHFLTIRVPLH